MQRSFDSISEQPEVVNALAKLAKCENSERGEIYTKEFIVEFILDLIGYTDNKKLFDKTLLEPSFGKGDFLIPAVKRLLKSYFKNNSSAKTIEKDLVDSISAVELFTPSFESTKLSLIETICSYGVSSKKACNLVVSWLVNGDFLLTDFGATTFDFAIGNPPYVRQEEIEDVLLKEYRKRFFTIYDRADLYVPFIQRVLGLLGENGKLSFICSDRWMKNKYGGPLRQYVSDNFNLRYYIDMYSIEAFKSEVSAYPSIFMIEKAQEKHGETAILSHKNINVEEFEFNKLKKNDVFTLVPDVTDGKEPWLLENPEEVALLRKIENKFPKIEEVDCKVGIGVATGNDSVFIKDTSISIEKARKLPLIMADEIKTGSIQSNKTVLVNPWEKDGSLIELKKYPLTAKYLQQNSEKLKKRHIAKKQPQKWYKTIDKVHHDLVKREKLLVPDIKGKANIVFDEGKFYPHHNLYFVVSNGDWEVRAIQAILRSELAQFFVAKYSLRMRGGYLRYQAQYLRRVRIPHRGSVKNDLVTELIKANKENDLATMNELVFKLYKISKKNQKLIHGAVKDL